MSAVRTRADAAAPIGLAVFLAAWSMWLLALCYASVSLRQSATWEALAPQVGGPLVALSLCALVVASSAALWRDRPRAAALLAALFLAGQGALIARGAALDAGHATSVLLLLTGFHAIHAAIGIVAITARAMRGRPMGGWGVFWHALAISWLVIAGVLFW